MIDPTRSASLDARDDAETALTQALALLAMAHGEGGEVFRRMSDEIQDNYLSSISGLVERASEALKKVGVVSATHPLKDCTAPVQPLN